MLRKRRSLAAVVLFSISATAWATCTDRWNNSCDQVGAGYTPGVGTPVACPPACHENPWLAECDAACFNAIWDHEHWGSGPPIVWN